MYSNLGLIIVIRKIEYYSLVNPYKSERNGIRKTVCKHRW